MNTDKYYIRGINWRWERKKISLVCIYYVWRPGQDVEMEILDTQRKYEKIIIINIVCGYTG